MPSSQVLRTNAISPPRRAKTNNPQRPLQLPGASGSRSLTRARPLPSVRPFHMTPPRQLRMVTSAPPTGFAVSSAVTQTSEESAPCLKWTARLVTSAAARTCQTFPRRSFNCSPRRGLGTSTMWRPACGSGTPTTSVRRASPRGMLSATRGSRAVSSGTPVS